MIIKIDDIKTNVKKIIIEFDDNSEYSETSEIDNETIQVKNHRTSNHQKFRNSENSEDIDNNSQIIDFNEYEKDSETQDNQEINIKKPEIPDVSERAPRVSNNMQNLEI